MFRRIFTLLLILVSFSTKAQKVDAYILQERLKNATTDTHRINVYRDFITLYVMKDPDSALFYIEEGKKLATKMDDPKSLGIMFSGEGRVRSSRSLYDLAKKAEKRALELFYHADYKYGIATTYNALGVIEAKTGNYKQATSYFFRSLKINEEIKNKKGIVQNYISIGTTNSQLGLLKKANRYYFNALEMMGEDSISLTFLNLCNNIGIIYGKEGNYEKSLSFFNRGLKVADKVLNGQSQKVSLYMNAAIAYSNTKQLKKAAEYYNEALLLSKEFGLIEDEARTLYNIALLYEESNPELAKKYFYEVLDIAKQIGQKHLMVEVYQSLYIINKKQQKYKESIEALEQFHKYQDTVMSIENTSAIELLQSEYDLEKSKLEIKELALVNQKQKLEQAITIIIIFGVLVILGVVAYTSSKRKRLNQELLKSIQVRDKLLSIIAHDLKTPINNVLALLDDLDGIELTSEEKHFIVDSLKTQTAISLETLENILKWGQSQIRGVKTNPINFELSELVNKNLTFFDMNAKKKNIKMNVRASDNFNVNADKDQIDFVIRNVLSNAIKFSNSDSSIDIEIGTKGNEFVLLSINDSGIGMNAETISSLFGVNQKINYGTAMERGSGLGLMLCKEFIEANEGEIWVESKINEGTRIKFTIKKAA